VVADPDSRSLTLPAALSLGEYPETRADVKRRFSTLRSLAADIFISSDARYFSMRRKLCVRAAGGDPVTPFIDRDGYLKHIDRWEEHFRKLLAEQQQAP
jgi:metallo-beta-lactamase class B